MLSAPHSSGGLRVATVVAVLVCCQPGAWAQNTNSILAYGNAGDPVFDLSAGTPVSAGGSGSILIGSWSGNEAHVAVEDTR